MRDAVDADPGFAVGHAALAVLGHEADRPADAGRSLDEAVRAVVAHGDERERSFVGAVAGLLDGCDAAGLLRHLDAWPRDALADTLIHALMACGRHARAGELLGGTRPHGQMTLGIRTGFAST